jgi:penicillin amidase
MRFHLFRLPGALRRVLVLLAFTAAAHAGSDPLRGGFTIYRDTYGVPHIVGDTEEATFFGYGFAQAQDHLERMMMEYRDSQGRRAEVERISAVGGEYLVQSTELPVGRRLPAATIPD